MKTETIIENNHGLWQTMVILEILGADWFAQCISYLEDF